MFSPGGVYMNGYILNLYKCAMIPKTQRKGFLNYIESRPAGTATSLLCYGDYDRIYCEKVSDFTRYRDVDNRTKRWIGPRQSILLYNLEDIPANSKDDLLGCFFEASEEENTYRIGIEKNHTAHPEVATSSMPVLNEGFLVVTMVTLNPDIKTEAPFLEVLQTCKNVIYEQVDLIKKNHSNQLTAPENLYCSVYGTFSSSELVVVWLTKDFGDAFKVVDCLRYIKGSRSPKKEAVYPFASMYSLVAEAAAKPHSQESGIVNNRQKNIKGYADIYISFTDTVMSYKKQTEFVASVENQLKENARLINETSEEIKSSPCAGEFDYCISAPARYICGEFADMFLKNGVLYWGNQEYIENVSKTQTQLFYEKNINSESLSSAVWPKELSHIPDSKYDLYTKCFPAVEKRIYGSTITDDKVSIAEKYVSVGLRTILKQCFPETVGLCDTLDLLYTDFVNNISNLVSTAWADDFAEQFIAVLDYIADIVRSYFEKDTGLLNTSAQKLMSRISHITNQFMQVIYHVSQSKRTVFIVPSCHLRYMGHYDMILHAYYGIIKHYIEIANTLHSTDEQPQLIPMLTVDVIPEIKTDNFKISAAIDLKNDFSFDSQPLTLQVPSHTRQIFSVNLPLAAMGDVLRYAMALAHETFHFVTPKDRNKRNQVLGLIYFSEFSAQLLVGQVLQETYLTKITQICSNEFCDKVKALSHSLALKLLPFIYNQCRGYYWEIYQLIMQDFETEKALSPMITEVYCPWEIFGSKLECTLKNILTDDRLRGEFSKVLEDFMKTNKETIRTSFLSEINLFFNERRIDGDIDQDQMNDFVGEINTRIEALVNNDYHIDYNCFDGDNSHLYADSYNLTNGFHEACQDLPMIRIFNLSFVDYLVFRNRHRHDLLDLNNLNSTPDVYRIAMIFDYLVYCGTTDKKILDENELDKKFEAIYDDYLHFFQNVPEMVSGNGEAPSDEKIALIKKGFNAANDSIGIYCANASSLRQVFIDLLADEDILNQPEAKAIIDKSRLAKIYLEWKTAITSLPYHKAKERVFEINLKIIHDFQIQRPLRDINSDTNKLRNQQRTD